MLFPRLFHNDFVHVLTSACLYFLNIQKYHGIQVFSVHVFILRVYYNSGEQVTVSVSLEREDEEEVSPYVIAPFFPQVNTHKILTVYVNMLKILAVFICIYMYVPVLTVIIHIVCVDITEYCSWLLYYVIHLFFSEEKKDGGLWLETRNATSK